MKKMQKLKKFPSDLLILLVWTGLTVIFVIIPFLQNSFIRTILGIPMILFIPGYVLIAALFPGKDDLETSTRIALSFGLSIAIVPLLGLLLNFTFGIRLLPILLTLCLYTVALAYIAAYRREKLPEKERLSYITIYEIISKEIRTSRSRQDKILTVILIFSIIIAIFMIYFVITTPKTGEKFTEFYMLDPEGKATQYPTELKKDTPASIRVGVVNHEYATVNYTIRFLLDGNVLGDTRIWLNHNTTWENNLTFVPDKVGKELKLELWLFNGENTTKPYRQLHLWVNVTPLLNETTVKTQSIDVIPTGKEIVFKLDINRSLAPGILIIISGPPIYL
jgi:uncharacterized membrane protein